MENIIIDNIPFKPKLDRLMKHLHIKGDGPEADTFSRLVKEAEQIAHPKSMYTISRIESRGDEHITIDGTVLESRILRVNTEGLHRIFPFVATCGVELAAWAQAIDDLLLNYYANEIKMAALRVAERYVEKDIQQRFQPGRMGKMNPGSLPEWPIHEQKHLFAVLGDTRETVGVTLNPSMLMVPDKSVSGIYFQSEKGFTSCRLCPVEKCPSRKAAYDQTLYARAYEK